MAVQGTVTWINRALKKIGDGTLNLSADSFRVVLLNASQPISAGFTGASGDARYGDLTGELSTGNGYANGGLALSGVTLSRPASNTVAWSSAAAQWTLTASITFKYAAWIDWTAANKDIVCFADFDTSGGSISPLAGLFAINPDPANGWLYWVQ